MPRTAGIQTAWETALGDVSQIMRAAAAANAAQAPPWWVAEIVRHDQRGPDLAVLTISPDQSLPYRPGQYLDVQVARWPRVWRSFSVANAPRASGLLDLHVRAVAGGIVSTALVHYARAGDTLLLGPARGEMTISSDCERDLLCIAGGTGLAPIKALIEGQISAGQAGQAGPVGAARRAARRVGGAHARPGPTACRQQQPGGPRGGRSAFTSEPAPPATCTTCGTCPGSRRPARP